MSGLVLLSGCTVYVPTQPHAPVIRAANQAEFGASIQPLLRTEVGGAYSPVKHVMVMANGSWRPALRLQVEELRYFRTLQAEAGAGTYWSLGPQMVLTATGGYGVAKAERIVSKPGLFFNFSNTYVSQYRKAFGQLGLTVDNNSATYGFGYRLTQVNFTELTASDYNNASYLLPDNRQWRHEPYSFIQLRMGHQQPVSRWQARLSGSMSFCVPGRGKIPDPYEPIRYRVDFNRGVSISLGLGIIYYL